MTLTTKQHGGKRPGAGRKSELKSPVRITIVLDRIQLDWLLEQGPASSVVRAIVARTMREEL
jgi:hypothetical protein